MKILVTGGAGFIGSFLVDSLVNAGHDVVIVDSLEPQVHNGKAPEYLNKKAKFMQGNVKDRKFMLKAMEGVEFIYHHASVVGIGQSNYEIARFVNDNSHGTAVILDILANERHNVKKMVIPSSNTCYGEGMYKCEKCGEFKGRLRAQEDITGNSWDVKCPSCHEAAGPIPVQEDTPLDCNSIYSYTKRDQENMAMHIGRMYGIPITVFRYFNVYGPRQSLSNPYTGVSAIFISRLMAGKAPVIYEDGLQTRDFISVHDVVDASMLAMNSRASDYGIFNVGTGQPITITQVALEAAKLLGKKIKPEISGKFRKGDIRHCIADISKIKARLGWSPKTGFSRGFASLVKGSSEAGHHDNFDKASSELEKRGLA
ncbi:MAG: NAD-dependent epimerase/dehydratase [archaeon GW2011_AR3]|nr:MAG: NAD-dependent epimerase/dehydratase [archaeon GW2011_AR3]MBS3109709.1 NAD-dependent epimerase/dehydratase family protein [Candidatus Woesearchaeota archaeon]